ncbi:MAG: serine hydrolase domain-containing protein [Rubrivivax sp.]
MQTIGRLLVALLCVGAMAAPARSAPDDAAATADQRAFDTRTFNGLGGIAEALPDIRSVVVLRRGRVAFEYHRSGIARDTLHPIESATKSVLSTLVGIALAQGRIASLEQPVIALMPELASVNADPRALHLSVRHLLTMTSGFEGSERRFFDPKERAQFAMSRRFAADPGTVFRYDNPASNLLAAVLANAVGETPTAYAQRQLFAPLGIERSASTAIAGLVDLGPGAHAARDAAARFQQPDHRRTAQGIQAPPPAVEQIVQRLRIA